MGKRVFQGRPRSIAQEFSVLGKRGEREKGFAAVSHSVLIRERLLWHLSAHLLACPTDRCLYASCRSALSSLPPTLFRCGETRVCVCWSKGLSSPDCWESSCSVGFHCTVFQVRWHHDTVHNGCKSKSFIRLPWRPRILWPELRRSSFSFFILNVWPQWRKRTRGYSTEMRRIARTTIPVSSQT